MYHAITLGYLWLFLTLFRLIPETHQAAKAATALASSTIFYELLKKRIAACNILLPDFSYHYDFPAEGAWTAPKRNYFGRN